MDYIEILLRLQSGAEFYIALAAYRRDIVTSETDDELQYIESQILLKLVQAYDSMIATGGYEMPEMRDILANRKESESRVPLYI
jgi:shikimate kinase